MKNTLSDDQIRLLRLRAQRLIPQPDQATPAQVLEAVCGVQAQEHPSALLALHVRAEHLTRAAIEQARLEQRAIVRTWAMRGTLHLLTAADARWLIPLLGAGAASMNQRRFIQLGWDASRAARGLRILRDALEGDAALTRAEIVALLKADGLPSDGQAPIHLIFRAAQEGLLCQGPDQGKQPAYVSFERWAGPLEPLPREEALARLARRYLSAYAPAGLADFAAWSGLKTGAARLGWQAVEAEAESFETAQDPLWLLKTQLPWLNRLDPTADARAPAPRATAAALRCLCPWLREARAFIRSRLRQTHQRGRRHHPSDSPGRRTHPRHLENQPAPRRNRGDCRTL